MVVPAGKRIRILRNGENYMNVGQQPSKYIGYKKTDLYLGEDLNLKTASEYGSPFGDMQEGAAQLTQLLQIGGTFGALTGLDKLADLTSSSAQSKFASYQFWKYSQPISFTFTINLYRGLMERFNAYDEVYLPTLYLMELVLPRENSDGGFLEAPGPTFSTFVEEAADSTFRSNQVVQDLASKLRSVNFSLAVGKMARFYNVIIKGVEATFSSEVDENGYPVKSTIRVEVSTTTAATSKTIQDMLGNIPTEYSALQAEPIETDAQNWATSLLSE